MLSIINDDSSIVKLKTILMSRYGMGLEVRRVVDLNKNSRGVDSYLVGEQLHIPLRMEDNVLGTAVIPEAKALNSQARGDIADLVRMILEPTMYNWFLDTKEQNLNSIISLKHSTGDNFEIVDLSSENDKPAFITQVIHIQSQNAETRHKAAVEIHNFSERWAMIPFSDVSDQLQTADDVKQMGMISLFVPDIIQLSMREQKVLATYLEDDRENDGPLLLLGSGCTSTEIADTSALIEEIKPDLIGCCFDLDRLPYGLSNIEEVLEMLFLDYN